ncbi:MAG TPA: DegQ family serine endoprotease [Solimonas sp.]|nr:DegQ family serine endoprotease [Solimonas sp.]
MSLAVSQLRPWWTPCGLALCAALLLGGCDSATPRAVGGHPDFADLVERVSPSVVNISTVAADQPGDDVAQGDEQDALDGAPEWFRRFFEDRHGAGAEGAPDDQELPPGGPQSLGSGFVLWEDGYIITNFHVVRDAREVVVRLLDRRQFTAKVIGSDEATDLSLLKIEADDLPAVKIGESGKLRPGQWVLAIGSPFGFDYSVTAGIVSAKGRALATEQYVPFIQTDVAINPGNSGGPLFNLAGEVIGVNSQIYSQSGGYQGVSFSIPIDVAAKVARELKERGRVKRGWLGVVVQEVDRDLAQSFKMDKPEGALVARVVPGGPADRAGIRTGDIILSFNGEELPSSTALPPLVGMTDPGQAAKLQVLRDGNKQSITVDIGALEPEEQQGKSDASQPTPPPAPPAALGLVIKPLSPTERRDAQVATGGVLVAEVQPGPAARAGVRGGDIVLQIAGQETGSPERFGEVVARLTPGQTVPLLVQRRGAPLFLALDVPGKEEGPRP